MRAAGLRCEHREDIPCIDDPAPRLSWSLEGGQRQTAYQLRVEGLWDSGRVTSSDSVDVAYAGPPLPAASELVMLYAGVVASGALPGQDVVLFGHQIDSHFWAYVAMSMAGVLGNTLGSVIGWGIGYYGGRPVIEKRGRWLHLGPENLDRAEHWFARWGDWAVCLGRVTPVVRSFVSIPAGLARMPLGRFTLYSVLGTGWWDSVSSPRSDRRIREFPRRACCSVDQALHC